MLGVVAVDRSLGELVTETPVVTGVELWVTMGDVCPVFPGVESGEGVEVRASDVAEGVLLTLVADGVVAKLGEDVPWEAVCV